MLTLKNIKMYPAISEETTAFSATLYWKNQKAGEASNRGVGGCNNYYWNHPAIRREVEAWAKEQEVQYPDFEVLDQVIDKILVEHELNQIFKRACKTKTLFRLKGDLPQQYREVKCVYTLAVKRTLVDKFKDELVEIINERYNPLGE